MRLSEQKHIIKNSFLISVLNFLGVVSGLAVDIGVAAKFGLGKDTDALFIALTIPMILCFAFMGSGSLALVPLFSTESVDERGDRWLLFNKLINIVLLFSAAITCLGIAASPYIVKAVGWGLDADTRLLAIELSRIFFVAVAFFGTIEIAKAMLNSLHLFGPAAAMNIVRNGSVLAALLLAGRVVGIRSYALGFLAGMLFQMLLLAGILVKQGYRYKLILDFRDSRVKKAGRLLIYPLGGSILRQFNVIVERLLASFLAAGTVSALAYAYRIIGAIQNVFANSISTAILPSLSKYQSKKDIQGGKSIINIGLRYASLIALPLAAFLWASNVEVIRLLFEREMFTSENSSLTASILKLYSPSIFFAAIIPILLSSFYSRLDTKTPFIHMSMMLSINIALDILLFRLMGVRGLALAFSITLLISAARAFWIVHRRAITLNKLHLPGFFSKTLLASLVAVVFVCFSQDWINSMLHLDFFDNKFMAVSCSFVLSFLIFFLAGFLLFVEEIRKLPELVRLRG